MKIKKIIIYLLIILISILGSIIILNYSKEKDDINLILLGNSYIEIDIGENYIDPGCMAFNKNGDNISNNIIKEGSINNLELGKYKIIYRINYNNKIKSIERTINVVNNPLIIDIKKDIEEDTGNDLNIIIDIKGYNYKHIILPDGNIDTNRNINYIVNSNGDYDFTIVPIIGDNIIKSININNIDKSLPNGICNVTINKDNTLININNISEYINKVEYYNNDILINENIINNTIINDYIYNNKTSHNVKVKLYDKVNNISVLNCNIDDKSYEEPIKGSSSNLVFSEERDSLKIYINKYNDYYISRIWAINPYLQLNKFDSPEYGTNLYKPGILLEKAISSNNLNNNLIVGFNASGFYLKDTYDSSSVNAYSKYNKTSVGTLVITNGKVIRNAYQYAVKTWFTMGINKDNKLIIFKDEKNSNIDEKNKWSQSVINSGIRNTYTFASPLVENGISSTTTTSMPSISSKVNRQAICQVNNNNFLLITGANLNRTDLINIMLQNKCITGLNLDGGGSIALLYKSSNSNNVNTITGNGRSLTEVGYFTEIE